MKQVRSAILKNLLEAGNGVVTTKDLKRGLIQLIPEEPSKKRRREIISSCIEDLIGKGKIELSHDKSTLNLNVDTEAKMRKKRKRLSANIQPNDSVDDSVLKEKSQLDTQYSETSHRKESEVTGAAITTGNGEMPSNK